MYHSITFGYGEYSDGHFETEANTWNDWHLIPSSRPSVPPPGTNLNLISLAGRNGSFDITDSIAGTTIYGDRSGTWEFIVDNGHALWVAIKETITEFIHGRKLKCFLESDPNNIYTGRFSVNEWQSKESYSTIVINFTIDPYKSSTEQVDDWLWDPFNFLTDRTDGHTV